MKLDEGFICQILKAVEDCEQRGIEQNALLDAIGIDKNDEEQLDKFIHHMNMIEELSLLSSLHTRKSPHEGFGFSRTMSGLSLLNTTYELTHAGYEYMKKRGM